MTRWTARTALAAIVLIVIAGCGSVQIGHSASPHKARFAAKLDISAVQHTRLNAYARRFLRRVPAGGTGYPEFGLILAPESPRQYPSKATVRAVLSSLKSLPVAQVVLAGKLAAPSVGFRIVTDYLQPRPDIRAGARFPAVVVMFHRVQCADYGPRPEKQVRYCTAMAIYDLAKSEWIGLYQF